jgi:hypothetical protein
VAAEAGTALDADTPVHRIGGAALANLTLKSAEENLDPAGFSVLLGGAPQEAADRMRLAFPDPVQFARLHAAAMVVGSGSVAAVRAAGFDVIAAPTGRLPTHGRVIHPLGAAGFTPANLVRLAAVLQDTPTPRS